MRISKKDFDEDKWENLLILWRHAKDTWIFPDIIITFNIGAVKHNALAYRFRTKEELETKKSS